MILDEEREALREQAREALSRRSLADFCERVDPAYEPTPHTALLCDHLDALERGEINRLAIFMPPRHGKTYHAGERFPAYCFGRHPSWQMITTSYTIDLARQSSRKARELLREPRWPFHDVALAEGAQGVEEWHTAGGGVLKAAGVGGGITGFGAHLMIIDDPVKGHKDAESRTFREATWNWYTDVVRTRLMRNGRQLLMMTRWHEDDLAGRILNSKVAKRWTVLRLPQRAEANDPLRRAIGEPLWPGGMADVPSVEEGEISARSFAALYQGTPRPNEGALFKREWLRYFNIVDGRLHLRRSDGVRVVPLPACKVFQMVDLAIAQHDKADYFVITTFAMAPPPSLDLGILEVVRVRATAQSQIELLKAAYLKWKPFAQGIEDVAYQRAFYQLAAAAGLPVRPVKVTANKETRAAVAAARYEAGAVFHLANAPWLSDLEDELLSFPAAEHDDMVDTISAAAQVVSEAGAGGAPAGIRVG